MAIKLIVSGKQEIDEIISKAIIIKQINSPFIVKQIDKLTDI